MVSGGRIEEPGWFITPDIEEMKMTTSAICTPRSLPSHQQESAARKAIEINPLNAPALHRLAAILPHRPPDSAFISVMTTKYWHARGAHLTVGFVDNPPADLRA